MDKPPGPDALSSAIEFLSRRELSLSETQKKLEEQGFTPEDIGAALRRLSERRILDDRRLADTLAQHLVRKGYALTSIRERLAARGIESVAAESAIEGLASTARDVIGSRRWKSSAQAARFLAAHGFEPDEVREAIESHFEEHSP